MMSIRRRGVVLHARTGRGLADTGSQVESCSGMSMIKHSEAMLAQDPGTWLNGRARSPTRRSERKDARQRRRIAKRKRKRRRRDAGHRVVERRA